MKTPIKSVKLKPAAVIEGACGGPKSVRLVDETIPSDTANVTDG